MCIFTLSLPLLAIVQSPAAALAYNMISLLRSIYARRYSEKIKPICNDGVGIDFCAHCADRYRGCVRVSGRAKGCMGSDSSVFAVFKPEMRF